MAQFYDFSLPDDTKNFSALDSHERVDLRDLKTFTIDPVQAKDLDDAVSIERHSDGYRLYVHIADVDAYVPFKSEVFVEAMKREVQVVILLILFCLCYQIVYLMNCVR